MGSERHLLNINHTPGGGAEQEDQENRELTEREEGLNEGNVAMGRGVIQPPTGFQAPALTATAGGQQRDIAPGEVSKNEELQVRKRAKARNVNAKAEYVDIKKGKEKGAPKAKAMLYRDVDSMAADPAFEARAARWESRFGGFVNGHGHAQAMAKKAGDVVLDYLEKRFEVTNLAVEKALPKLGTKENTFSGAVGNKLNEVRRALNSGSVSVKMNHFQKFAERFVSGDIIKLGGDTVTDIITRMGDGNAPNPHMTAAINSVKKGGRMQAPEGIAGEQWHTRAERTPNTGVEAADKEKDRSQLTYGEHKEQTGSDYSGAEKRHMRLAYGKTDNKRLPINEGGEKWIMNERDKWVKEMREMSLPLKAGPSGTTARLMQAFRQFGINDQPAHSRAALIAYILPNRHHSLVEVMTGAAQNGGPAFTPSRTFYKNINPFTQTEVRGALGNYPDEE